MHLHHHLTELVTAARNRDVAVGGVAPLECFPALPWPLRSILGSALFALGAALAGRLPRLVVERFSARRLKPDLVRPRRVSPKFPGALALGEKIAALALSLVSF